MRSSLQDHSLCFCKGLAFECGGSGCGVCGGRVREYDEEDPEVDGELVDRDRILNTAYASSSGFSCGI